MTGVPITSVRVDRALNEIAENYTGGGGLVGMFTFGRSYMDDDYVYYKEIEIAKMTPTADEEITYTSHKDRRSYS